MFNNSLGHFGRSFFALLVFVCFISFSQNSYSQEFTRKGNIVTYRGNKFIYPTSGQKESHVVTDPITGKKVTKTTTKDQVPLKMNKLKVYSYTEITMQPSPTDEPIQTFVIKGLSRDLGKLPDGAYFIDLSDVIVDNKGKIVYYEYGGVLPKDTKAKIPDYVKTATEKKIDSLVNAAPGYSPGELNGKPVVVRMDIFYDTYKVTVKNHKTSISREP